MFENKKPMIFDLDCIPRHETTIVESFGDFKIEVIYLFFEDKYIFVLKAKNNEGIFKTFSVSRETFYTQTDAKFKGFKVLNECLLNDNFRNHIKEQLKIKGLK